MGLGLCAGFLWLWQVGGYLLLWCAGFSLWWLLLLRSTGCRHTAFSTCSMQTSVAVAHELSCPLACGIFLGQESNPCPLYWQAHSQPLDHQGNPSQRFYIVKFLIKIWISSISTVSDSSWPHGLQHSRLLWPSQSPEVHPSSCPLHQDDLKRFD